MTTDPAPLSTLGAPRQLWRTLLAGHFPDTTAFGFLAADGTCREWTRSELARRSTELGRRIRAAVGPAEEAAGVVAVLTSDQEAQVLHFLGALAAGLVPAVLTPPTRKQDPRWFAANLTAVLEAVSPALVLTDQPELLPAGRSPAAALWTVEPSTPPADPSSVAARLVTPPGTAFLQFSSGTTGHKKGVAISTAAVLAQLATYGEALAISAEDGIVSWLPLYHDMGLVTALLLPLAHGIPCRMLDPIDWVTRPDSYLHAVTRYRPTLGWHPNFAYAFLAERFRPHEPAEIDLGSLRALVNCGEPTTFRAQAAFTDCFRAFGLAPEVFTGCWAMAETTFALTHLDDSQHQAVDAVAGSDEPVLSVGRPLPGVEVEVRAPSGCARPDGEVGELWARAPFLAEGYAANPSATATAFVDGWYRTGDLGYRRDGALYVRGRANDLLIVSGHNVFPDDVEALVGSDSGIRSGRVAAFGEFDARVQTQRVVVLAESDGTVKPDRAGIMQALAAGLNLTGVRLLLVEPNWLVKSSSGKISRAGSAAKWRADREARTS